MVYRSNDLSLCGVEIWKQSPLDRNGIILDIRWFGIKSVAW